MKFSCWVSFYYKGKILGSRNSECVGLWSPFLRTAYYLPLPTATAPKFAASILILLPLLNE